MERLVTSARKAKAKAKEKSERLSLRFRTRSRSISPYPTDSESTICTLNGGSAVSLPDIGHPVERKASGSAVVIAAGSVDDCRVQKVPDVTLTIANDERHENSVPSLLLSSSSIPPQEAYHHESPNQTIPGSVAVNSSNQSPETIVLPTGDGTTNDEKPDAITSASSISAVIPVPVESNSTRGTAVRISCPPCFSEGADTAYYRSMTLLLLGFQKYSHCPPRPRYGMLRLIDFPTTTKHCF
jgi:hypothetical protein